MTKTARDVMAEAILRYYGVESRPLGVAECALAALSDAGFTVGRYKPVAAWIYDENGRACWTEPLLQQVGAASPEPRCEFCLDLLTDHTPDELASCEADVRAATSPSPELALDDEWENRETMTRALRCYLHNLQTRDHSLSRLQHGDMERINAMLRGAAPAPKEER